MQLKKPEGGIAWLSALWIIVGGFLAVNEFLRGDTFFVVLGCVLFLCGSLVWIDVREIAWALMIWFSFIVLCGIVVLVLRGLRSGPVSV